MPAALPPAAVARRVRLPGTFASLRYRGYLYLWVGVLFASGGHWMEQVAIGWLVYEMTDSPWVLGSLQGVRALPFLIFSAFAGVAADRMDRKMLMLVSQSVILGLYLILLGLLVTNTLEVWHLFVFTIGGSLAWSFNAPVRHATIPELVPRDDLVNATALQSGAHNATRILGPALGGILMAAFGGVTTFAIITVTFLGVMITTALIPITSGSRLRERARHSNMWQDLVGGIAFVASHTVLRNVMLLALVPMVFGMSYIALAPVFARDVFGMDARGAGELLGATGIGAVASTLAVATLGGSFRGKGLLMLAFGFCMGLALIAFAASTFYPLSLAAMALVGLFSSGYMVLTGATIQLVTPQEYMGRVMSLYMLDRGLMPVGSLIAGALAEAFGGPTALAAMGAACAALILVAATTMRSVRELR